MLTDKIFNGLNDQQFEAVNCLDGPLLVLAGAGSGKTRVLTCRIANLIANGVPPWNILAITFTNKAANEMKSRAISMIGDLAQQVWLSTFHSFCAQILRMDIDKVGFRGRSFVIYDVADSRAIIRDIIEDLNLDSTVYNPMAVQATISAFKNNLDDSAKYFDKVHLDKNANLHDKYLAKIYMLYEAQLAENNAVDFDDLLLLGVKMLEKSPEIKKKYQSRFQYILIDEYQDTNLAQYRLSTLLAETHHNICVVGDADQSIYGFRGADIRNILSFEKDYPEATVIFLEQNYRSTGMILEAANSVIENNIYRKPKNLWTKNPRGERLSVFKTLNEKDEARRILNEIQVLVKQGFAYRDIALLYRINAQSRALEEALMNGGLPYIIIGGLKFYNRREIKDIISYLKLIFNRYDSMSLKRIINVPKRGVGETTIRKLNQFVESNGLSLFDVISNMEMLWQVNLKAQTQENLFKFARFINDCAERQDEFSLSELVLYVLNKSGYMDELEQNPTPENEARLENLGEFINVAKDFAYENPDATLEDFLNNIALVSDLDNLNEEKNRVSLMTVHSAKGLEFPVVFITGFEDGLFPHANSFLDDNALEEERRAAYVAITRAKKKLYITYTRARSTFGISRDADPSRFIKEIPNTLINFTDYTDYTDYISRVLGGSRTVIQSPQSTQTSKIIQMPAKNYKPDLNVNWYEGDRIRHMKWGDGTILQVKGKGDLTQLLIRFDDKSIGKRNLIIKYAPIEKI